ncbi:hypothetical protein GCM10023189_29100 [Nibrella saemangeumensis]|uniref:DKNYY family protein n=1 Tax=Nibrella saemangeumensis TaxID=1084526 RepID=A0ABP8N0I8_9BACT
MYSSKVIGWLLVLSTLLAPARAQLAHSVRLELTTNQNIEESFDVTPLADRGVLVTVRRGDFYDTSPARFHFSKYDTDLKPVWTNEFKQDPRFEPVLSYHNDHHLYWLFREKESAAIQIIRVSMEDGLTEQFTGDLLNQMDMQHFKVLGNTAYVGGYYRNRPVVMTFSFFDRTNRVLPGLYVNHMEINSLEIDENRQEVHVLAHSLKRNCQFSIRSYTYEGKPLRTVNFDGSKYSLISGKLVPATDNELLLVGNYSTDCTPYSQGIYITRIKPVDTPRPDAITVHTNDIRYIEFSQLQNFFNYLKPKRQERLLARILKKKEEGKDVKFRYRLLVHDPIPTKDGLTLLAEVYYPQYRGTTLPYQAGMMRSADRYFEGYRYTHAFLCGFDKQGKLLWDNCLAIQNLNSPELTEMVQVSQQGDLMVLAYPQDGEIHTEVIRGSKVLKPRENYTLKPNSDNEKVLYSTHDNLAAWYDHYFLACGFQKIGEKGYSGPPREVFYITKLNYSLNDLPAGSTTDALPPKDRGSSQPGTSSQQSTRKISGSER